MRTFLLACRDRGFTPAERRAGSLWMIGSSLFLATLALVLKLLLDDRTLSNALLWSAFPMALLLAGQATYLKPYSRTARIVILVVALSATYLFFLGIELLSRLI